ncbi:hypothetical protein PFISCL1PPCAC_12240, partial [Pristionchus fissidentatus]
RLRLRLSPCGKLIEVCLFCDKSDESHLWWCTAFVKLITKTSTAVTKTFTYKFASWETDEEYKELAEIDVSRAKMNVEVKINTDTNGCNFRVRPTLGVLAARDCVLIVGGERVHVNKQ